MKRNDLVALCILAIFLMPDVGFGQTPDVDSEEQDPALFHEQMKQLEAYDGPVTEQELYYLLRSEQEERERELRQQYGLEPLPIPQPSMIEPAPEVELPDGSGWILTEGSSWEIGSTDHTLSLPVGFFHDKASIPQALQWLLKQTGQYSRAAAIHDFLYWQQDCTRLQSDNLLMIAMKETGVLPIVRQMIYGGVRLGGWYAWKENAKARKRGVRRVYMGFVTGQTTSESIQKYAHDQEVALGISDLDRSLAGSIDAELCALGDSTDIPSA